MKKLDISKASTWEVPENWLRITTLDAHTGGEPLRIILEGYPDLPGNTILEKRRYAKKKYEHIRKALIFEPRGHADMYGSIIVPPVTLDADVGILFIHNEGFSTMCGHAIIALTKMFIETGMFPTTEPETVIKFDVPSGLITSFAKIINGKVASVYFRSVPAFVLCENEYVEIPDYGKIRYDVAFGGAFYAFVYANDLGLELSSKNYNELIKVGMDIKHAVIQQRAITHPFEEELSFLYGTIFIGGPISEGVDSRNVCIFAEGEVDRCPTGSGVSARMALHYRKRQIKLHEPLIVESILGKGSTMIGSVHEVVEFGPYKDAVIPQVEGNAYIMGRSEFIVDPDDPLKEGFIFR